MDGNTVCIKSSLSKAMFHCHRWQVLWVHFHQRWLSQSLMDQLPIINQLFFLLFFQRDKEWLDRNDLRMIKWLKRWKKKHIKEKEKMIPSLFMGAGRPQPWTWATQYSFSIFFHILWHSKLKTGSKRHLNCTKNPCLAKVLLALSWFSELRRKLA